MQRQLLAGRQADFNIDMDSYLRVIWGEKVMTELCAVAFGNHIDNLTFNIQDIVLIVITTSEITLPKAPILSTYLKTAESCCHLAR